MIADLNKIYDGYLNGSWILFEYDKTKITHNLVTALLRKDNDLKVVINDNVGNSTIFETHFFEAKTIINRQRIYKYNLCFYYIFYGVIFCSISSVKGYS
jgi:hypothetical protein